jgi:hypothetical protein
MSENNAVRVIMPLSSRLIMPPRFILGSIKFKLK